MIDHFGILAPFYDHLIPFKPEKLVALANLPVPGLLLDIGGGTGRVSRHLVGLASGVVVADLSLRMLRQAVAKDGLLPVRAPAEALPFASQTFERVIMVDALHHVISHAKTACELWRVLKPGGRIVIEEPDIRSLAVIFVAVAEKMALMRSHFLTPARIKALFTFPGARIYVTKVGYNALIVIEKENSLPD